MPTLDSDHNHYTLGRHRQNSQSSGYGPTTQPASDPPNPAPVSLVDHTLPTLPAYTYNLSPTRRPVVSTTFKQHASNANVNGVAHDFAQDDESLDPHDFYRRYQDQFVTGSAEGLGQADIVVTKREDSMVASRQQRRSSPISARANGSKLPPLASRVQSSQVPRNSCVSSVDNSPLNNAKSTPALSNTTRNRQTSLKDLVHRFNQTPDEVPPLPRKSASRSTSTNSNPSSSVNYGKARTLSQSKSSGFGTAVKGSVSAQEHIGKASRLHQRRGRNSEDVAISPVSPGSAISLGKTRPEPNSYASQSLTDLTPEGFRSTRRPLFGEVSAMSIDRGDLGYGIPILRRRRGSEGSMHSPNPIFPVERRTRGVSPSSPTAWYLGVTPTLEEIKMEKTVPSLPPSMHRRTRSDFTGAPPRRSSPDTSTISVSNLAPPLHIPSSPTSTRTFKRDSQSRIPVSSRRLSINSDSGNSTPSTRNNSAMGKSTGHTMPPKKGPTSIPKPGHKARSPVRNSKPHSSRNSPRRGDYSPGQRPATSPRLAAYITAPLPKKSPPLRSSRPRQPVSSASTSASRARAVDRLSGHEGVNSKTPRDHRSKRPPELGGVDFAARRQKIQQAFTKTVKENERQEVEAEKRRISLAQETKSRVQANSVEPDPPDTQPEDRQDTEIPRPQIEMEEEAFSTPAEELSNLERELSINTGRLSERPVLDINQEDSPTLGGGFNRFSNLNRVDEGIVTPPSDREPLSAVTAGTSDTVETFFDNEPQEEPPNSYQEHRSLLSHIMSLRDSSPASSTGVLRPPVADDSTSEKDDRESIQIMLSDTPVLERASFVESPENKSRESVSIEEPGSRWSMSSWTSSTRSKDVKPFDHERDAPMERIDENSPSKSGESTHLSVSSASTNQTPQQWSPATFASPQTDRTTMDADAYSTINRVLDHYHDPSLVSPELMNDVQQHILTQSPDLARLGGWDPKKVTQLYLQELARGRYKHLNPTPSPLRVPARKPVDPHPSGLLPNDRTNATPENEPVLEESNNEVQELPGDECPPPSVTLNVDHSEYSEYNPQRASLNAPADWEMSPSISDWIHLQAVDSPQEERPMIPPKDWRITGREDGESSSTQTLERSSREFRPQLPEIKSTGEGLGIKLAINITSPQDGDSPTIPPPPLPNHLPPPPPEEPVDHNVLPTTRIRPVPSPNISSKPVPSSNHPISFQKGDASVPAAVGSESPRRSSISTSTAQESTPLPMSQARKSTGAASTLSDTSGHGSSPSHDQKRLTRRRHIIQELVDTEHSFGQDMKVVDDIYRGTSNVIIISAEDVKTLFGNSDQIVAFSTSFLDALKQAAKCVYVLPKSKRWRSNRTSNATSYSGHTDDQSSISGTELNDDEKDRKTFIGEAFGIHMTHMEKVYSDYLRNHDAANHKLQALQKNQKVQIWLKECRAYAHDLTSAWDLDSLLVKPVQRILKYPLLLDQLLEVTPENHPDYNHLDVAAREMKGISMRINEMKKRADLMEQVATNRKRKESDVRIGLSKAFGRRAEKLRQQVGLTDTVEDKGYAAVSEKFGSHFFQLQVVMRDVEMYVTDVQTYMERFNDFVLAIEAHIDVGQSSYPEVESKWRKFRMSTREISNTALTDHIFAVRKNVIEPMTTLLKLQEGPQKLMQKRNKRILDYARFKALKDRGERPDKKTVDQGEQFMAINETLKDELPKLFSLTKKLVEACLSNFVQLQLQWHIIWRRKLSQAIDDCKVKGPGTVSEIMESFSGDFTYFEAQVLSLGICNGSMLADAVNLVNFLSPTTTLNGDGIASPRHTSSLDLTKRRTLSISSDASPMLPQPDFGTRGNATFFGVDSGLQLGSGAYMTSNTIEPNRRMRASSTVSSQGPRTPEMPGAYRSYSNSNTPGSNTVRPTTAITRTTTEPSPSLSRQSLENSNMIRSGEDPSFAGRPSSGPTYPQAVPNSQQRVPSPAGRYSGFFSSAMPMSDSPPTESPTDVLSGVKEFVVIFLAASVYEFNIDRARREAGYPYLTYVAGEIFDVIGEKGELWLAKNQDDSTNQVGWIWNKHFVKLAS